MEKIDYEKLAKSIERLNEAYKDYLESDNRPELRDTDKEYFKEALVQRFEVCVDTSRKHLFKYLKRVLGIPDINESPKSVFRAAFEADAIPRLEQWFEYVNIRNATSHNYGAEFVDKAISIMSSFIEDVKELYWEMEGANSD